MNFKHERSRPPSRDGEGMRIATLSRFRDELKVLYSKLFGEQCDRKLPLLPSEREKRK